MASHVRQITGKKYLCLAGGVALNCVANGKLLRSGIFEDIFIQPAAGDAGGALGCAYVVWYQYLDNYRKTDGKSDFMNGASPPSYIGPVTPSGSAWYTTSEFSSPYVMNHSGTNTSLHYGMLPSYSLIRLA